MRRLILNNSVLIISDKLYRPDKSSLEIYIQIHDHAEEECLFQLWGIVRAFVTMENVKYRTTIKYLYMKGTFRARSYATARSICQTFSEKRLGAVFDTNDLNAKLTEQNLRSRNILSIWSINLKPCSSLLPKIYNRHEGIFFYRSSCCLCKGYSVLYSPYTQKFYVLKITSRAKIL